MSDVDEDAIREFFKTGEMSDMDGDAIHKANMPDYILDYFSKFYSSRSFHYSDKSRLWHALRVAVSQRNDLLYMLADVDQHVMLMASDELPDRALPRSVYLRHLTNKFTALLEKFEDVLAEGEEEKK